MQELKIIINNHILQEYKEYYFSEYPRRKKFPISSPIPPSLNSWMILPRFSANAQKQAWKEFGIWLIEKYKLTNKKINKCTVTIEYFFNSKRIHDADNYLPKNLFDAFTESGLIIGDDFGHVESLTIKGNYSREDPRTEFSFFYEE